MAVDPEIEKQRAEKIQAVTEKLESTNNLVLLATLENTDKAEKAAKEANKARVAAGRLTKGEITQLKEVIKTGQIDGKEVSKEVIAQAQKQLDLATQGTTTLDERLKQQSEKFVEDARSKETQRVADLKLRAEELVILKERAQGIGVENENDQAAAQLELKRYEEAQKKIGIFTKIANRTVQKLEDIGAEEGESAEAKEQRLAGQKVFGKIRDGVMKTGEAFDKFAGDYGKKAKEGGLALLKGFAIGLIIISLMKFIKSPAFDDLLESLGGFFGFIDGLIETFGVATTLTLGIVALFKPKLLLLPLKGAIAALKFGYKLLSSETYRSAVSLKFTKTFKSISKATTFLGSKMKLLGTNIMSIGKSVGTSALSLGSKALVGLKAAGIFMKTTLIALGKGLLTFATTTLMPMLVPLAPFIAIGAAIAAVLYSLYEGFQDFRDSLASGDSLVDAIIAGVSKALATLISLPALAFQGLLEFVTGLLGFDSLSERIGNVDIVGTVTDSIKNILMSAKDFLVDLFTFDTANFPSFGDFGGYAKRALATLARNVLPEPGGFLAKFVPDSVYEFAGINPETGEFLTQQNTQDMDGGVEAAMIQKKKETEKKLTEIEKDEAIVETVQETYFKRKDRHAGIAYNKKGDMIRGKFVSEGTKQRADQRASLEMQSMLRTDVSNLESKEAELATQGGQLSEEESRELRVYKQILEQRGGRKFDAYKGGMQTFGMDLYQQQRDMSGIHSEQYQLRDELNTLQNLSPDAVRDQDLVTNKFVGMEGTGGFDLSGQKLEDSKTIIKKMVQTQKTKTTGGIDAVAGGIKSQVDAITKLIDPEQIEAMRDKVIRINQILKDGITEEERKELGTLGVNIRAPGRGRTLSEAILTQRATSEAVTARDVLLANNADMREVQKTASNINNVVSPTYNTSNSNSSVSMPIPHDNKDIPAGVHVASLTR